jgi:ferric-dicitrate binding protein FerR (iron transport regulator)
MAGDEIQTGSTQAVILFRDGSAVTLSDQAVARVEKSGNTFSFRLLSGSMEVVAAKESALNFYNDTQAVDAKAGAPVRVSTKGVKPGRFAPSFFFLPLPPPTPATTV